MSSGEAIFDYFPAAVYVSYKYYPYYVEEYELPMARFAAKHSGRFLDGPDERRIGPSSGPRTERDVSMQRTRDCTRAE